jgi:hypothetical protein
MKLAHGTNYDRAMLPARLAPFASTLLLTWASGVPEVQRNPFRPPRSCLGIDSTATCRGTLFVSPNSKAKALPRDSRA